MSYVRREISQEKIKEQKAITACISEYFSKRATKPLAFVDTYGCQQNVADSERLRGMLSEMGYEFTDKTDKADIIVINTCAVREHAEMRILGNVGALVHTKKANPDQIIALCGCMVQQPEMARKIKNSFRHVDIVFGPQALWRFPEFLYKILREKGRVFSIDDTEGSVIEGLPVSRDGNGTKAWLSIMYGCNNFCSYCIVPYVRGRERSRRPEIILQEAEELVSQGYKDITLLGQNVNSYGKDLSESVDFSDILRLINDIPGDFLIRFMTSHPKDAGEKLFRTMAECDKVAKHIHLPFQAGNNRILKVMNRGYTREDYLDLIHCAKKYMPDLVLTSDIIVGFPGESDSEFEDTLSLIEEVEFDALFTFIYSRRSGTPAASMEDPYTKVDKQKRFDRLIALQNSISSKKHSAYRGTVQKVLVDGFSNDARYPLTARTNGGRLVHLNGDSSSVGSFTSALITDSNTWALFGEEYKKDG